ncbi:MAG: hypothetical protein AAF518_07075 [Spirochaetota bacterium]
MQRIKNGFLTGFGLSLGLGMGYMFAVTVGTLNTFSSGSNVSSSQINSNFTTLKTAIETLNTEQETIACILSSNSGTITTTHSSASIWTSEELDTHNAFDQTTGVFTVPKTGLYQFTLTIDVPSATAADWLQMRLLSGGSTQKAGYIFKNGLDNILGTIVLTQYYTVGTAVSVQLAINMSSYTLSTNIENNHLAIHKIN